LVVKPAKSPAPVSRTVFSYLKDGQRFVAFAIVYDLDAITFKSTWIFESRQYKNRKYEESFFLLPSFSRSLSCGFEADWSLKTFS